ncbi:hypothetical protein ABPG75_011696 [Micractinium tetrahymenae]
MHEEVCISYGPALSNADLLCSYGFTLPGNPHNRVALAAPAAVRTAGPAVPSLSCPHLLAALGLEPALSSTGQLDVEAMLGEELLGREDADAVQQRRAVAAVASLPLCMPDLREGCSGGSASTPQPLSAAERQQEQQAAHALQAQCQEILDGMPSTAEEDEAVLAARSAAGGSTGDSMAAAALTANARAAVSAGLERKQLLQTLTDVLQRYCKALA